MRTLLLLLALFAGLPAHAEDAETSPPVPPVPPSASGEPTDEAQDEAQDEASGVSGGARGPCWSSLAAGVLPCLAVDALGGALLGLGFLFANLPSEEGGNCVESCVLAVISAGMVVLGVIFGVAGLLVLGPVAAIVVTVAASVGSVMAGRAFWGAALGGLPGVLLGVTGVALAAVGLSQMSRGGALQPGLFSGEPASLLVLSGAAVGASAGVASLLGAFLGDLLFTSLSEDEPAAPREASRRAPRGELPLALDARSSLVVAY